ncbi:MAG: Peptidoglycan D,D-transpeptidase MrdA [uncultured Thiotrichaceae bacterium]|uniref:Peptidoglycan D,D-transpeptidase MrdA n=1 Tax=uncultured Thiotrichaceae bacterium TaxID=298394 RepID=A0A6S6SN14_9GAMM|nr:MAG: Peptidoglycan D,D-transpeptidase MrdA [uncultured Thiotrichaceae bacterium]
MAIGRSIKDQRAEKEVFRSRIVISGIIIALALVGISSRLLFLQIVNHDYYLQLSKENYQRRIPTPPVRGQIFDRNGVLLAGNHIEYVLEVIKDEAPDLNPQLDKLGLMLDIEPHIIDKIRKKIRITNRYQPVAIKKDLTDIEIAIFSANRPRFPGFKIALKIERYYPLGSVAGHLIGYVGRIDKKDLKNIDKEEYKGTSHIGKSGIEKTYESLLHGKSGYQLHEVDSGGKHIKLLEEKVPTAGQDLFLTLDINLQTKAEDLLRDYNGAAVAIDPNNGEVLAMASMPVFDPNLFVNGISHKAYSELRDNPSRPLYSRAYQGVYPPGSTIKPMVAIAGLNAGIVDEKSSVYGGGYFQIPGNRHRYRCWKKSGHGFVRMNRAIYQSCDVYFYDLSYRMGIDRFNTELSKFGFSEPTGLDVPHEKSGLLPSRGWKEARHNTQWYPGDSVNIGIGQGYWNVTPVQLAHAVGIVAMRGRRAKPHLLRGVRSNRDNPIDLLPIHLLPDLVLNDDSYWEEPIRGMVNVVHGEGGTARRSAQGAEYRYAGKTGTAQVFGIAQNKTYNAKNLKKELHDHSLFVAFAPLKDPKIAVSIIAENAGGGSKVAAPLAREFMDAYLVEPLPPSEEETQDKKKKR